MHRKEIVYDRESRDYACYLDGELVYFARSYHEGEVTLDNLVFELMSGNIASSEARRIAVKQPTADHADDDPFGDPRTPEEIEWDTTGWAECDGGWEKFGPHPFDPNRTVRHFRPRLFSAIPTPTPDPLPSGPMPPETPPGGDGVPLVAGRAIARHFHRRPRHFIDTLRRLDPAIWQVLASAYVAYRGGTVDQTLTAWWLAVSETQHIPADYRADFVVHPIVQAADASAESYAGV